jgi:Astacin (Peptidase family M12A)
MALVIGDLGKRWSDSQIPYEITADFLIDVNARQLLATAINQWNSSCKVKLVGRSDQADYVQFRRDFLGPCHSPVGRQGGRQFVSCYFTNNPVASILHEIGHAVGLHHEQQRRDRNGFVIVNPSVINDINYRIESTGAIYTPYDCGSIMHYPQIPGKLTAIPGACPGGIGSGSGLSLLDIETMNGLVLDSNAQNVLLAVNDTQVYLRHGDGGVFVYSGTPSQWNLIDANGDNEQIVADGNQLYLRHGDGGVFVYSGTPFQWNLIDANGDNEQIAASGGNLYLRHGDGGVFVYSGTPFVWNLIDANGDNAEIAAGGGNLYLRHNDGGVFRWTGTPFVWLLLHTGMGPFNAMIMVSHKEDLYLIDTLFVPPSNVPVQSVTTIGYHSK